MEAILLAEKHDGTEVLLAGRKVSIAEQLALYRSFLGSTTHAEFCRVQYQDQHGGRKVWLMKPAPEAVAAPIAPEIEPAPRKGGWGKKFHVKETTEPQTK